MRRWRGTGRLPLAVSAVSSSEPVWVRLGTSPAPEKAGLTDRDATPQQRHRQGGDHPHRPSYCARGIKPPTSGSEKDPRRVLPRHRLSSQRSHPAAAAHAAQRGPVSRIARRIAPYPHHARGRRGARHGGLFGPTRSAARRPSRQQRGQQIIGGVGAIVCVQAEPALETGDAVGARSAARVERPRSGGGGSSGSVNTSEIHRPDLTPKSAASSRRRTSTGVKHRSESAPGSPVILEKTRAAISHSARDCTPSNRQS